MDWLDLLAVQATLKSLLQHHSSKASVLQRSAFFIVQFSHPYMEKTALTRWTFVGKVMSLIFNIRSRLVIDFLPRNKCLLISWLRHLGIRQVEFWHWEGGWPWPRGCLLTFPGFSVGPPALGVVTATHRAWSPEPHGLVVKAFLHVD